MKEFRHILTAALMAAVAPAVFATTEEPDTLGAMYGDLDELVITARKEVVKSDGAKLTYDLEQDDTSKGQSLIDAIRKVPMLTVDGQDNIKVKGSSNFKIYVNGKEDPMLTANYAKVFRAMPAESVAKIEVITEPGAKYDAEGVGGIINLVTERVQRKDGFAGTVNAGISSQMWSGGLFGRMKYGKFSADANVNYANNAGFYQANKGWSKTINENSDQNYRQLTDQNQRVGFQFLGATLNMSWEPTSRDLFAWGGNINYVDGKIKEFNSNSRFFSRAGDLTAEGLQRAVGGMKNLGVGANASYKHNFNDKGHNLIATYFFNFGRNPFDIDMEYENVLNYQMPFPYQHILSTTYQREHTATLDWTLPLMDGKHTIEAGAKGVFRRNMADSKTLVGIAPSQMTPQAGNDELTRQMQDVYAAYATYSGQFGKLGATAGVRYELTHMGLDFLKGTMPDFRRDLNDVVPNAALTWMFTPASNLRLAYQMRISRPSIEQLNPYKLQINPTEVRSGNPDLESEKYNTISLTYSNYGRILGGNIGVEFHQANNTIEEYNYFDQNVRFETYMNMGRYRKFTINGYLNWNITQRMTAGVYAAVNYTNIKGNEPWLKNHGWAVNYNVNWSYRGPWDLKFSAFGGQSSKNINLQGRDFSWYYYGIGISKSFLKEDALTVSVNANNFLTKYTHFSSYIRTPGYSYDSHFSNRNWNVGLNISWNFGHLQEKAKKTGAELQNDDLSSKKSGNGGGGGGLM